MIANPPDICVNPAPNTCTPGEKWRDWGKPVFFLPNFLYHRRIDFIYFFPFPTNFGVADR